MAVIPKAEELWCRHSVQWQTLIRSGLLVGVVNWIFEHWQRPFMPIVELCRACSVDDRVEG